MFAADRRAPIALVGATAATAALVWFGTGLHPAWWLTWFVPLPLLAVAPSVRAGAALAAAFCGWIIGALNLWSYAVDTVGIPVAMVVVSLAVAALIFAAAVLLFRALAVRRRYALAVLASAGASAGLDWALAVVSPNGIFQSPSITQADQSWILPAATIGGPWLITALLWALPAGVAVILRCDLSGRHVRAGSVAVGGTVIVALALSLAGSLLAHPSSGEKTTVAAIAAPLAGEDAPPWSASSTGRVVLAGTLDRLERARRAGATVAVVSESTLRVDSRQVTSVTDRIRRAAGPRLSVVIGMAVRHPDGSYRNEALLVSPAHPVATYLKRHLVPGQAEHGLVAGDAPMIVTRHGATWGVAICKDLDFSALVHEYAGTGLLLAPGWDFGTDGWYHSRMALVATAANGLPTVRAARNGYLTVSGTTGDVIAQSHSRGTTAAVLTARVPARGAETPYARFGDWLAYLGLALAAAGLWFGVRPVASCDEEARHPPIEDGIDSGAIVGDGK